MNYTLKTTPSINGYLLTEEEVDACLKIISEMRAEKERERKISKCKKAISFEISASIGEIGLDETKRIVRGLERELREFKEDENEKIKL